MECQSLLWKCIPNSIVKPGTKNARLTTLTETFFIIYVCAYLGSNKRLLVLLIKRVMSNKENILQYSTDMKINGPIITERMIHQCFLHAYFISPWQRRFWSSWSKEGISNEENILQYTLTELSTKMKMNGPIITERIIHQCFFTCLLHLSFFVYSCAHANMLIHRKVEKYSHGYFQIFLEGYKKYREMFLHWNNYFLRYPYIHIQ